MLDAAADAYAAAFDARCAAAEGPGGYSVEGPGIRGLVPASGDSPIQLLVVDDRAFDVLAAVLPLASTGTVRVHDAARRCAQLLRRDPTWTSKAATAMVCHDLGAVPHAPLPAGLTVRPVRRVPRTYQTVCHWRTRWPSRGVPRQRVRCRQRHS